MEQVDFATLIREHVAQHAGPHHVQLNLEPHLTICASPGLLGRVVDNLLDNAHQHAESVVQVAFRRRSHQAELAVADDGEGIPEADRERIFQRFTRLDTARSRDLGGTGLGLAIAREIAHAHHGTLHADTATIGGACFILRLPFALADPRPSE